MFALTTAADSGWHAFFWLQMVLPKAACERRSDMAFLAVREEEAAERMAEAEASLEAAREDAAQAAFLLGLSLSHIHPYMAWATRP